MEPKQRTFSLGFIVIVLATMGLLRSGLFASRAADLSYSEFKTLVKKDKVSHLTLDKQTIGVTFDVVNRTSS